jgi:hypothetical protein
MESYLVQVWVPADEAAADADLRGVIRHVGSGVETPFHGEAEVVRLLHQRPGRDAGHDRTRRGG